MTKREQLIKEAITDLRAMAECWPDNDLGAHCEAIAAKLTLAAALEASADTERLRHWLDNNTTFMDVDADWPVEGNNIPTLAQVSNRIWYHATDDQTSYPFSAVIDAALAESKR